MFLSSLLFKKKVTFVIFSSEWQRWADIMMTCLLSMLLLLLLFTKWADRCHPHFSERWFGNFRTTTKKTLERNKPKPLSNRFHSVFITSAKNYSQNENCSDFFVFKVELAAVVIYLVCVCVCVYFLAWNQSSKSGYESNTNVFPWMRQTSGSRECLERRTPSLRGGCARGPPTRLCSCTPDPPSLVSAANTKMR